MKAERFLEILESGGIEYFVGVPDSQLASFTNAIMDKYKLDSKHHVVAVNEGSAVGMAAGYHLASGKIPCVYMQNSGLGNAVNPITSLLNKEVYGIGCLFVIGYRGQIGTHDEPQHQFMGKITLPLLELLGIEYVVLEESMDEEAFRGQFLELIKKIEDGDSVAIVVKKKSLTSDNTVKLTNNNILNRESVVEVVSKLVGSSDIIVSTTGKISRELYEAVLRNSGVTGREFLTVGSMGHCSSIALAIAIEKRDRRVVVLDGDGAVLMHMGSLASICDVNPNNYVHILLDNNAHETVGGMPTVSGSVDFCSIARNCGYSMAVDIDKNSSLEEVRREVGNILKAQAKGAIFVRIPISLESRADLLRPKERAIDNKKAFMNHVNDFYK